MSSHFMLRTDLSFVVVPTFKESICKIQTPTFFGVMVLTSNLRFTHVRINTIPHAVPEKRSLILIF
ncbi:hypothetical protein A6J42_05875 [Leptospira interrogans serovar Copenhageni]|uniref:Uncharacterized protein n=2 Tax=Leptospira interrogans TaxID=173 RepID=A0AAP9WB85_LEPIR|nr:hypothetical protein A6J42_05875 [Leptospira interrogans serovar Copenhageni]KAA1287487.1 hypothetical protein C4X99_23460 [Leptospira interrogans serovar Geyaweera]MBE0302295.1 hypothetical protein [Leptospira interrogans serovar Yeoncheon]OOB95400.1 hypothetical protein B0191_07765 [Leptospira interrogans serovar Hardjo]OOB98481.1 hypothetical protein B0192_10980 [Leptospira interrogans serovar Australis]QCO33810.1 hypothetical protein E4414_12585 [Leptospira interrogans]QOI37939.1 hypot